MKIRDISPELVKKFKILCAALGQSQNKRLKILIEQDIDKNYAKVLPA